MLGMDISHSGFRIEEQVLSATECDSLLAHLATVSISSGRAGTRHLMSNEAVREIANDGRLLRVAENTLGLSAVPFRATLFAKSGAANWLIPWHQDTALPLATSFVDPEWAPWSQKAGVRYAHAPGWALSRVVALRVHLDDPTRQHARLLVGPDSQTGG